MKKSKFSFLLSFALLLIGALALIVTSCDNKWDDDKEFIPDGKEYVAKFGPQVNGEVVPWIGNVQGSSSKKTMGFAEYNHKYFNHVIRIWKSDNTFVVDIPITDEGQAGVGSYQYSLISGSYKAEVIPVMDDIADAINTSEIYTPVDIDGNQSFDKAPFYTQGPVSFNVAGVTSVSLPCITDFSCLQFDNGGQYDVVGNPIPQVLVIDDATFITAHDLPGNEEATYVELGSATTNIIMDPSGTDVLLVGTHKVDAFWWDAAEVYYLYMIPGTKSAKTRTVGDNTPVDVSSSYPSYLGFDVTGGTGSANPTLWLQDYYDAGVFLSNMTLRITLDGSGDISVTQMDWFNNIVSIGDAEGAAALSATAIESATHSHLDVDISGGVGPYQIDVYNEATYTTHSLSEGVDAIYTGVGLGLNTYGAFAEATLWVKVTDSESTEVLISSIAMDNWDIVTANITNVDGLMSVTSVNYGVDGGDNPTGFGPWTYEWYDDIIGGNLVATTSSYQAVVSGDHFLRVIDGTGQTWESNAITAVVPLVDVVLQNLSNTSEWTNDPGQNWGAILDGNSTAGILSGEPKANFTVASLVQLSGNLLTSNCHMVITYDDGLGGGIVVVWTSDVTVFNNAFDAVNALSWTIEQGTLSNGWNGLPAETGSWGFSLKAN